MQQYLRKVSAELGGSGASVIINPGGIQRHEMKISFSITKDLSGTPNEATIEIWNLSEGHRNAVGKELDNILLRAGYMPPNGGSNVGVIFKGQLRDVEHRRDGPDIITKLSCGDGDKAFRNATISKTFPKGTKVQEVVEELYKQMEKQGIARGEWKGLDRAPDPKRPVSMCGTCTREMDRIGRSHKLYWSFQNEVLEILPGDGFIGGIALIAPETGMIGTPAITDNGCRVSCLLNPEIRPGRRVQIESEVLSMNAEGGIYRVSSATYSGDNRDGDFTVQIDAESITGGTVDEGIL